ncbi:beta-lactamase-like protein [Fomitopsis serialis]|uniref:beta-lactamase-like protein n=1 Tax=Fomitopsis serialis TaxID=139415 RepID=UPI0020086E34|nr:beta-lactamase-like protein [Neoantrodia serialis]KAH9937399.1 beta-lactamase-like protein [Neoantrodia serialis]
MHYTKDDSANASTPVEFIFMGTGTSSCVPHVDCLTRPPEAEPCLTCLSTLTPEGKRNARRNTSAVVRLRSACSEDVTILIDCGKSFQSAAVEWFPKFGLRRIDAVLITHAHADAMNGLDDLRGWTLRGAIQLHIDLYVSMNTFKEVQRAFPYLISKEYASGGGDVPEFKWHIIEEGVPFEIGGTGVQITPFAVHHGRIFTPAPPVEMPITPHSLSPASTAASSPNVPGTPLHAEDLPTSSPADAIQPYLCFGFIIQDAITYISDVSHIPEHVWAMFKSRGKVPPVLVLDCLRILSHTSHLGIEDSVETARRMGAKRTYLLGFSHDLQHDDWVTITEAAGGENHEGSKLALIEKHGLHGLREGDPIWVRPAFDGLRVFVSGEGSVRDEGYSR